MGGGGGGGMWGLEQEQVGRCFCQLGGGAVRSRSVCKPIKGQVLIDGGKKTAKVVAITANMMLVAFS